MMHQPFFTFIVPTFNSASTLIKCLNSIFEQTYKDFEIIIIDGLSTDETIKILSDNFVNDNRIRWISEKDEGIYDAMNKGIKIAVGEYLFFLGSDDYLFDKNVLRDIHKEILKSPADLIYGKVKFLYSNIIWGGQTSLYKLLYEGNICHQAIFYKKKLFQLLGNYNINYKIWADWEFNLRCFRHSDVKTHYIDRLVSVYNEEDGLSAKLKQDDLLKQELPLYNILGRDMAVNDIKNSKEYKLGLILLRPLRTLKRLVSSYFI